MENLLNYLLTVILRDADDVNEFGMCCGEKSFIVDLHGCIVLTKTEIRQIRTLFAERWRWLDNSERRAIYENLKKMKQ